MICKKKIKKYKILGLIPARGGSKRIPHKNIKKLLGKPLIAYTIEQALKSKMLDRVIVSTDDKEIAKISKKYGAEIPFMRPKKLARDNTLTILVVQHALRWLEKKENYLPDFVVLLQPTTPLRKAKHIDDCIKKLIQTRADSVISVTSVGDKHPMRMKRIVKGRLVDFIKEPVENMPRQKLPQLYIRNGAIYATKSEVIMKKKSFKGRDCRPYIMPEEESVNIDDLVDFELAKILLRKNA